jgi:membrane-bound serine protease (ClpP class)
MKRMRRARWIIYLVLVFSSLLSSAAGAQAEGEVLVMDVTGPVTPVMLSYIQRGIQEAEARDAETLLLRLNTPGGDVDLTKRIIQAIVASDVPVTVYVSPRGAFAASAGTFITLAGHVAAMAPSTSIGAASPVGGQGEEIGETMREKIVNILQADIEGLARRRGEKAVEWARKAVSEAEAATAEQALELGVIDFIAEDTQDLLRQMDGFSVTVNGEEIVLQTDGAPTEELPMSTVERILHTITNPNIAFILMTLGINGILFELSSPGGYLSGVVGAICLLLAFYALGVLDVNYTGLLFIALAFVLFVLDIKAPTHGALTLGGIVAFVLGSLILFNSPFYAVSWYLVVSVGLATGAFFAFVVTKAVFIQRRPATTGVEGLVGALATARTDLAPTGKVFVHGEWWQAEAEGGPVQAGQRVRVLAVDGFTLRVAPAPAANDRPLSAGQASEAPTGDEVAGLQSDAP